MKITTNTSRDIVLSGNAHNATLDDLNTGAIRILDREGNLRFIVDFANAGSHLIATMTARDDEGCVVESAEVRSTMRPVITRGEQSCGHTGYRFGAHGPECVYCGTVLEL